MMSSQDKCAACGRSGRRQCPALAGQICSVCCGTQRGSTLSCPPSCPFYPFGTAAYDAWLQVDGDWQRKSLEYVASHLGSEQVKALMLEFTFEESDP
jgi:hypothetical protein